MLHIPANTAPSPEAFRTAMRNTVGQVSIITVGTGLDRSGLVATSAVSLSTEPPMMLVCVNRNASAYPLLAQYGHFGINLLSPDQQNIAERFSGKGGIKGAQRYDLGNWFSGPTGAPLLCEAIVAIDCEIEDMIDKATHSIVTGRVRSLHQRNEEKALAYWNGKYLPIAI